MEKTFKSSDESSVGYGDGYLIDSNKPGHLVGRLLTLIEAIGLPEKQEKSFKDLVSGEVYNTLELNTWIPGQLNNIIRDFADWFRKDKGVNGVRQMNGEFTLSYKEKIKN